MVESSMFWDGISLGDATTAPYSATEFAGMFAQLFTRPTGGVHSLGFVSRSGVSGDTGLQVSGAVSPVAVSIGQAMVLGRYYQSTTVMGVVIPTPVGNPRIDRVVLRLDFAAQTIRLARVAGTTAATPLPPALTQVDGTTWEISLAQVNITTGGIIEVRDERLGAVGMGGAVLFRDVANRVLEEFFDNFVNNSIVSGAIGNSQWQSTLVNTGVVAVYTGTPSAIALSSGATAASSVTLHHGSNFPHRLSQSPILFEWYGQTLNAAADAQTTVAGRLANSGLTQMIEFGVIGSLSTTNLVVRATNAGASNLVTAQAIDATAVFHKFGIYSPFPAGGPITVLYDGVPIGHISTTLPAIATDLRAEFFVGNGSTATVRSIPVLDWARLVRGTA